jgi:hypothetical protein
LESSNWREAKNLVMKIEAMAKEGRLGDREVFIFTDNIVFEGTFYKGHSHSPKLNQIILQLRIAERMSGCILHVIHVAGTRMKEAGIDGLSRGDFMEGIMAGMDPLSFIPLNEGADERVHGRLKIWVDSWWRDGNGHPWFGQDLRLLTPEDWFELHTMDEPRLWMPPPAAMETVMEMFNEDRMAHPHIPHVFLLPRLMTHLWRKQLKKDADVVFTLSAGSSFWPRSMHEPLIVLIVLPFAYVENYRGPWTLRGDIRVATLENQLESGFKDPRHYGSAKFLDLERPVPSVWKDQEEWSGSLLRKFFDSARSFPPVLECMVRRVLPDSSSRPLPHSNSIGGRGKRRPRDREGRHEKIPAGKRRRPSHGHPL